MICAALIGRRVFLLTAVIAAAVRVFHKQQPAPEAAVRAQPDAEPVPALPGLPDSSFRPPREMCLAEPPDLSQLRNAMSRAIAGQAEAKEALVLGLLAGGHVLLEGAPGLGKTLACMTLARALGATFSRIQCHADLAPGDVLGCEIFDQRDLTFKTRLGPLFANVVLADEINRAPSRAQAATLEAMEEHGATIGTERHALPDPFLLLATMNDAENDGVFPLPAAQLDRFMLKIVLDFPSEADEVAILDRAPLVCPSYEAASDAEAIRGWKAAARATYCAPRLKRYIVDIVRATRDAARGGELEYGAGPRAGIAILRASRARAMLDGRKYVLPGDIDRVSVAALRHRVRFRNEHRLSPAEREAGLSALVRSVPSP